MKGFTKYVCEINDGNGWAPCIEFHDPVEADRWLKKAKKDGHTARVTEIDE